MYELNSTQFVCGVKRWCWCMPLQLPLTFHNGVETFLKSQYPTSHIFKHFTGIWKDDFAPMYLIAAHIRCKILAAQMSWQHLINAAWIPTRAELTPLALGHHFLYMCSLVNNILAFNISILNLDTVLARYNIPTYCCAIFWYGSKTTR